MIPTSAAAGLRAQLVTSHERCGNRTHFWLALVGHLGAWVSVVSREGRLTGLGAGPYVSLGTIQTYPAGATLADTRGAGYDIGMAFFLVFVVAVTHLRPNERRGLCWSVPFCWIVGDDDIIDRVRPCQIMAQSVPIHGPP